MTIKKHGLSIGIERVDDHFFLAMKAIGKLSHEDYQTITPMIDAALEGVTDPEVNVLIDATEMEGWALRAAWDDFKLGLKHGNDFKKIAIIGNQKWQENVAKIGGWFISGEVAFFESEVDALGWLHA